MTTIYPNWQAPPGDLLLEDGEVHIWRAVLEPAAPSAIDEMRALLAQGERQRADRFHFERHRARFTVCRGTLRTLLGHYLKTPAGHLHFAYGEHGKPQLQTLGDGQSICFNLAHSRDLALFAFSRNQPVGIDLEFQRPMPRAEALARRFFSVEEYKAIMDQPPERRQKAFYSCWTRKEAYVKATGAGFSFPMERFSVSLAPGDPVRLIRVSAAPEAPSTWTMAAMIPAAGFIAALVVKGGVSRLRWWEAGGFPQQETL